jgi:signal transduction histidine kinase
MKRVLQIFLITICYFLTGWLGLKMPYVGTQITLIWLPTGIAVVSLLKRDLSCLVGIYLGAFLVNFYISSSVLLSLSIAIGNTISPLMVALILKKHKLDHSFTRSKDTLLLILASCLGMTISAIGGIMSLYFNGLLPIDNIAFAWLSWWMGDTVGVLLLAPLLLSFSSKNTYFIYQNKLEVLSWFLLAIPISYFSLNLFKYPQEVVFNFEYLVMPMIVWVGLRFGIIGSSFSVLLFSTIAALNTALGYGNFAVLENNRGLLSLWVFVLISVIAGLIMSAIQAKQRQSEENIRIKNEELRKINQEKDKFFSIIAHDLRSPLGAVIGFSDLLIDTIETKEYEEIGQFAHYIKQSSDRALNLLSNLMEWTRLHTGRIKYAPEFIEIESLLNENISLFKYVADLKSISVEKDFCENITLSVDKYMINTIIRNLISNAIKFTPEKGKIKIKTNISNANFIISFTDTGVGMQEKQINKLFKIDNTFSTAGTNGELGTGLGLILCKEFIEQHNGSIWVESKFGEGSTFSIKIPLENQLSKYFKSK